MLKVRYLSYTCYKTPPNSFPSTLGSRDPYYVTGAGAGFVFGFSGNTTITVGHSFAERELIQVKSEKAFIAVPEWVIPDRGWRSLHISLLSIAFLKSPEVPFVREGC